MSQLDGATSLELTVGGLRGAALDAGKPDDVTALQVLLVRCADFFELVEHEQPGPDAARELLHELPTGKTLADKLVIGFWDETQVVAVADLIRNFPTAGEWCVGLLLVDPERRGGGLGARLFAAVEAWAGSAGAQSLNLIVQARNPGAARFWRSQQFESGETVVQELGDVRNEVVRMRKRLNKG